MTSPVPLVAVLVIGVVAALEVHVPEVPVVALYGQDVTLHCTFTPASPVNLSELSVYWELADTKRSVHSFWAGRDQLTEQADAFANRTSLFPAQLGSGNASLLLRNVRIADDGIFSCFVSLGTFDSGALVLQVAAPYTKPQVTLAPDLNLRPGDEVSLTCVAYGGFPQAQVQWQDALGRNMTDNVTISQVASEEGLFNVRSVLRVVLEPNSTYSCRLHNPLLGEEGHASVTITGQNTAFPAVALWVTVGLAICLLGLLIALAVVCRRKIKESCEEPAAGHLQKDTIEIHKAKDDIYSNDTAKKLKENEERWTRQVSAHIYC